MHAHQYFFLLYKTHRCQVLAATETTNLEANFTRAWWRPHRRLTPCAFLPTAERINFCISQYGKHLVANVLFYAQPNSLADPRGNPANKPPSSHIQWPIRPHFFLKQHVNMIKMFKKHELFKRKLSTIAWPGALPLDPVGDSAPDTHYRPHYRAPYSPFSSFWIRQ